MSTIIQIKRSTAITAPDTDDLAVAELAYAQDKANDGVGAKLYIESVNNDNSAVIHAIGGKFYTDIVDGATDANTASKLVKRDASGNFAAGTITAALTGNASTATTLQTARNIGGVSFDGAAAIDLPGVNTTGNQNTSGSAATLTTARTIGGVSFNGSENIDLPGVNTTGNQNTSGSAATLTTGRTIAITGDLTYTSESFNGSGNVTGTGTLATVNANVGAFGSTTAVPVITVNAKGLITSVTTDTIATSFNIAGGSGEPVSIAGGSTLTFAGTANEINTVISAGQVQIALPDDVTIGQDLSVSRNLVVTGNLTVNGTTSTLATTNTLVKDTLLELGNGTTGAPGNDSGIVIERGDSDNVFMGWDESADKFTMGTTTGTGESTGNLTITVGTLVANIEGNITGGTVSGLSADIAVSDGGTGAGSFTANGILYGNGTDALQVTAAGTNGYFLYSNNGTPAFTNVVDGGTYS